MPKHLLFDLETIPKLEVVENLRAAFELNVLWECIPIDLKKSTVDSIKAFIDEFSPDETWCKQHILAEIEGKNRKGVKDALHARVDALSNPIPKDWMVVPELQKIITFGVAEGVHDEPDVWQFEGTEDSYEDWLDDCLVEFWAMQKERQVLTCFNGCGFDIPILMLESKRLGIKFPQINCSSYRGMEYNLLDVMKARYGHSYKGLRASALAAGLPKEVDTEDTLVSGANVALAYEEGRYDEIETHCRVDILRLQACCKAWNGIFFNM